MSGGIVLDLYAVSFGALAAGIAVAVHLIRVRLSRRRPYDWAVDGECDNRSHVKVVPLSYDEIAWHDGPQQPAVITNRRWLNL